MVSISSIIAMIITLIITLIIPFMLPIIYSLKCRKQGVWKAWLLGAAGFVLLQMIIRMPILSILGIIPGFQEFCMNHYVMYCFFLALTAALFEVVARVGVAKILAKKVNVNQGLAAGLGHGGIEAVLIVGMTYVNNLIYTVMVNTGVYDTMVEQTAAQLGETGETTIAQLWAAKDALVNTSSVMFYLAGYERVLTMICHAAMSLLICYLVWKKKTMLGVVIVSIVHFMLDFVAPLVNGLATEYLGKVISQTTAYVLIYSYLTIMAVGCMVLIVIICKKWKRSTE